MKRGVSKEKSGVAMDQYFASLQDGKFFYLQNHGIAILISSAK